MILPKTATFTAVDKNQKLLFPSGIRQNLPGYPTIPKALERPLVSICIELVVGEDGAVASVSQIDTKVGCEPVGSPVSGALLAAVAKAARQWQFLAAAICTYRSSDAECEGDNAEIQPIPVKLAYQIDFTVRGNKPLVQRTP